ncbi:MAG: hypothetical protein KBS97_03830 [Firmicutes bacterium]|nr:hypothetical protein [Candidatus Fiminaster equi]
MRFPIPAYIFLGLFVVASIIQLVFAFTENQKFRRREKFACLLMLGLAAVFAFPNEPLIYVGAFLGMIGDILVLRKKTFIAGTVAFLLGHICYIMEALWHIVGFENITYWQPIVIVLTFALVFTAMFLVCKFKTKHSKVDVFGQSLYFAVQTAYIPTFIFSIIQAGNTMYLSLAGAIFFILSDCILVKTHFGPKFKRYDFCIMLTYLLAEVLIISGFVLTLAR